MSMRRLLVLAALIVAVIPSTEAGKVKGIKGSAPASSTRNLKKEKGDGKIPKVKKAGPGARTCKTCKLPVLCCNTACLLPDLLPKLLDTQPPKPIR